MVSKEEILSRITPKNDIVFKKIFGAKGNEGILAVVYRLHEKGDG